MQPIAVKHRTGRWNTNRNSKELFLKVNFAVFRAQKEVVEPPSWVQNAQDSGERYLSIM